MPLPRTQQSRRARRDDCIARMIRKPNRARLTADVALLLSSGMRLLVRHVLSSCGWLLLFEDAAVLVGVALLATLLDMDRAVSGRVAWRAVELDGQRSALEGGSPCLLPSSSSMLPVAAALPRRCRSFTPAGRREQGSALRG